MLLENPAHVRTAQSIARMSDEQVYRLYHRMVRELESQHQRDVDLLRSLIRALTERRGGDADDHALALTQQPVAGKCA